MNESSESSVNGETHETAVRLEYVECGKFNDSPQEFSCHSDRRCSRFSVSPHPTIRAALRKSDRFFVRHTLSRGFGLAVGTTEYSKCDSRLRLSRCIEWTIKETERVPGMLTILLAQPFAQKCLNHQLYSINSNKSAN
jgi:hypothetical protein